MTNAQNAKQSATAMADSCKDGGKTRMKPWSLIRDEKLETQKGIANKRKVCHLFIAAVLRPPTLRIRAMPMTALMPTEFIQMPGAESK
jgi:hypothetical protein